MHWECWLKIRLQNFGIMLNKVFKVDNIEISQSEFSYELQKQWAKLRVLLGDDISEDSAEEKQALLASDLAEFMLNNALLDNTMMKNNIDFSVQLSIYKATNKSSGTIDISDCKRLFNSAHCSQAVRVLKSLFYRWEQLT